MKRVQLSFLALLAVCLIGCTKDPIYETTPLGSELISISSNFKEKALVELEQKKEKENMSPEEYRKMKEKIERFNAQLKYMVKMNEFFVNVGFNRVAAGGIVTRAFASDIDTVHDKMKDDDIPVRPSHYRELAACLITEGRLYTLMENKAALERLIEENNEIYKIYAPFKEAAQREAKENPSSDRDAIDGRQNDLFYKKFERRRKITDGRAYIEHNIYGKFAEYFEVFSKCELPKIVISDIKYTKKLTNGITLPSY